MTTQHTTLPGLTPLGVRLLHLAGFMNKHDLPEATITLYPSGWITLHASSREDVTAWAAALRVRVQTQIVTDPGSGLDPFVRFGADGLIDGAAVTVSFVDYRPEVIEAASHLQNAQVA